MTDGPPIKDYACPECGQPMERGYMWCYQVLRWNQNDRMSWLFPTGERLTPFTIWRWTQHRASAVRCRDCGLVLFRQWER